MLLGIDTGGTTCKAVVFSRGGNELGTGVARTERETPHEHWAERDMDEAWSQCGAAIAHALSQASVAGSDISAVGVVGHGDGLYPVGSDLRPTRAGILAVDSRTKNLLTAWRRDGVLDQVRDLTGQQLFEPSQAALCAWLAEHEPRSWARTRWLLTAKDWLRLCLTGRVGTDTSEAMASFGARDGCGYEPRVGQLLGIPEVMDKLPPISAPTDVAGVVTADAANLTGLRAGTPVVFGTHDVVAGALGAGVISANRYCVVAGTWGVNEALANERVIDARWQSRAWVHAGCWLHMAASPASASNLDWLLHSVLGEDTNLLALNEQVNGVLHEPSGLLFYPFLYGSPQGAGPSGAFLGLHGWHRRAHLARAVFEGVVFNHLQQLNALRSTFGDRPVRLTGGGARSNVWGQLFADATGTEIEVPAVGETGCWGAAVCAAVGAGMFASVEQAGGDQTPIRARYTPREPGVSRLAAAFTRYQEVLGQLDRVWPLLYDDSASTGRSPA